MNGPQRTACFTKRMPNYTFFTLDSTWFEYTLAIGLSLSAAQCWQCCRHELPDKTHTDGRTQNYQFLVSLQEPLWNNNQNGQLQLVLRTDLTNGDQLRPNFCSEWNLACKSSCWQSARNHLYIYIISLFIKIAFIVWCPTGYILCP